MVAVNRINQHKRRDKRENVGKKGIPRGEKTSAQAILSGSWVKQIKEIKIKARGLLSMEVKVSSKFYLICYLQSYLVYLSLINYEGYISTVAKL